MTSLFLLLFLASFVCIFIGLIKPTLFKKFFKEKTNRKIVSLTFTGLAIVFFISFGVSSDNQTASTTPTSQTEASTVVVDQATTTTPVKNTTPTPSVAKPVVAKTEPVVTQTVTTPIYGVQTKTSGCVDGVLPDPACSPGAVLTTDVPTVCTVGYTKTVRNVSIATKRAVFAEYGISYDIKHSNYEVDHIISLEIGGSNDISNLFPESYLIPDGARVKDVFENYLHRQICSGAMTIQEAQKEISTNWLQYATADGEVK